MKIHNTVRLVPRIEKRGDESFVCFNFRNVNVNSKSTT